VLTVERRRQFLAGVGVAAGALIALLAPSPEALAEPLPLPQTPCYNGVFPLNPYVDNCGLQPRPPRVIGSAPDQTALLNCSVGSEVFRAQCISLYVNGGYGMYPGAVLAPGYHP
jgi:hypothetical protein